MSLIAELSNLIFYCVQQLGVTLGLGAETIMLAAYLISMRDGVVDEKETQYARAIKRTMSLALVFIVISGIGITILHLLAGNASTVLSAAYLFKWLLIVLVVSLTLMRHMFSASSLIEGVIGGTWFALFLVHILAPVTGWFNFFTLYAVWLAGFVLCWEVIVVMHKDKKASKKIEAPEEEEKAPIIAIAPVPQPKSVITLAPDLPKPENRLAPPPAPRPVPQPAPRQQHQMNASPAVQPLHAIEPSPRGTVTDTPFLPAVPALQPMTFIPPAPQPLPAAAVPVAPPLTTMPGGTSAPLPAEGGLSGIHVMPKAPPADKK